MASPFAPIAAAELAKLVGKATEAAAAAGEGDAPAQERCLDILKVLAGSQVSAGVLKETDAGKRINRLCKSSDAGVAAAAAKVVAAWKACVKRLAAEAGGVGGVGSQASGSLPGVSSAPSMGALAAADSGGGGEQSRQRQQEAASAQPAAAKPPPAQQAQRPVGGGGSGGGSKQPPKVGDPKRDKIRGLLLAGLAMVPEGDRADQDPALVAAEVESAIFHKYDNTANEYAAKVRSISFNLKDPRNPDLRRRVVTGEIDAQELVNLTPEEMASEEKRRANHQIRQESAADLVRGQTQQASTDMFTCSKCKQKKCTYYQMQTRSADEPMTTFVTCVNCSNKWKFC